MKTVTTPTYNTITNDYHNVVGTVMHAEWQMNRFFRTVVDNTPSEDTDGYDIELFPIESITKTNRPVKSGIAKAVVGQAVVGLNHYDSVPATRYYVASQDDSYKYWQSPLASDASTFVMTNCAPQVTYVQDNDVSGSPVPLTVNANKIYFTIENSFAQPTEIDVQIKTTTGGSWVTVADETNFTIDATGRVELWFNGSTWTTTQNLSTHTTVSAVRILINKMNKSAYFNLIELGVSLELDLTADVSQWSDEFTMGEEDFITPLGNISSNSANVTLFNDTETYSNSNPSSILYGLLDRGVIFRCWMKYGSELVKEFEMYSDTWNESEDSTAVSIIDASTFFMSTKPPVLLYKNITVQEAVWRICDTIGFNNYNVTTLSTDPHSTIDIFWTDGQKTAWELFGELSRATQTAIYFDSFGVLQIATRGAAWDSTQASSYTFNRTSIPGGAPANIVSLSENNQYEANQVTVSWKPTSFSETIDNVTPFEVVWEPDSTAVLRATALAQDLLIGGTNLYLQTAEGRTWPWSGMANIEGEWVSFDAKWYVWYDASGTRQSGWVQDYATQQRLDAASPANLRHLNNYTGRLRITERGLYNTEERDHKVALNSGWTKSRRKNYGTNVTGVTGITYNAADSNVTIESAKGATMNDYTYLSRGLQGYWYLGTRMRINKTSHKDKVGGIFFNGDGSGVGAGYYVEVMSTARMNGKMRNTRNELVLYSMKADGTKQRFGGQVITMKDKSKDHTKNATIKTNVGAKLAAPMNVWLDIDITFKIIGTDHHIQVWTHGNLLFEAVITAASGWQHSRIGYAGLYVVGQSSVSFDYFYGFDNNNIDPIDRTIDNQSYYDRIEGGYYGNQIYRDWNYEVGTVRRKVHKKWTKKRVNYLNRYFDEFGPIAHQIKEFDIKFTSETPVLESYLYLSNKDNAVCTDYVSTSAGAKFTLASISRIDAIISGDEETGGGTINQKLFVYGRPVIQKDTQTIVKTDDWAQRRRGIIDVEYESDWIQNQEEADNFSEWLTTHWSRSDSTVEVEVFGNPLIEMTDTVTVHYKDIDAVFYVTGVSNTFDNGLSTTLTLRKAYDL